jgi:hypothetical protein
MRALTLATNRPRPIPAQPQNYKLHNFWQLGLVASTGFARPRKCRQNRAYFYIAETRNGSPAKLKSPDGVAGNPVKVALGLFAARPRAGEEARGADNDPIVRVSAGRLRHALHNYYANGGCDDPIIIELPLGNYVPVFSAYTKRRQPRNHIQNLRHSVALKVREH